MSTNEVFSPQFVPPRIFTNKAIVCEKIIEKILLIALPLIFAGFAIEVMVVGANFLPEVIMAAKGSYLIAGGLVTIGLSFPLTALLATKVKQHRNLKKAEDYLLKNYHIVHSSGEGSLREKIKKCRIFLLGEAHTFEMHKTHNNALLSLLWRDTGIFLSETGEDIDFTYEHYGLDSEKVHRVACWDIKFPSTQVWMRKSKFLVSLAKNLLKCSDALQKNTKDPISWDVLLRESSRQGTDFIDLEKFNEIAKQNFKNFSEQLLKLLTEWADVFMKITREFKQISKTQWKTRQNFLIKRINEFYNSHRPVFLIAGINHLVTNQNEKYTANPEIIEGLQNQSFMLLLPRTKADTGVMPTSFPLHPGVEEKEEDNQLPSSEFTSERKEIFGFSSPEDFPFKEKWENFQNFSEDWIKDSISASKFGLDALLLIAESIEVLNANIKKSNGIF